MTDSEPDVGIPTDRLTASTNDVRFWPRYRCELLLALAVFVLYAYHYNGALWNQNARLNTIFAFVEPGTDTYLSFRIDRFITDPDGGVNTGDWSQYGGHYYANKAPGPMLLGIPVYAVLYHGERLFGLDPLGLRGSLFNAYLIHLSVTVLPVAVSAAFFFHLLLLLTGGDRRRSLLYTVSLYWGTLMLPFSTQLWGHASAAAFIIIAYCLFAMSANSRRPGRLSVLSGLAFGTAVLCEYSAILVLAPCLVQLLWHKDRERVLGMVAGGALPALLHGYYHMRCFGSPFAIANQYNNPRFVDPDGSLFGAIQWEALWGLTLSPYRGLFIYMPILCLILPALWYAWRGQQRRVLAPCIFAIFAFFLMNITFNGWHGGASVGPRYQVPVLALYLLVMTALPATPWLQRLHLVLLLPSMVNMWLAAAITPAVPANVPSPLVGLYRGFAKLVRGEDGIMNFLVAPIRDQSRHSPGVREWSAFNWGEALGMGDRASAILWFVLSAIAIVILYRWTQRAEAEEATNLTDSTCRS